MATQTTRKIMADLQSMVERKFRTEIVAMGAKKKLVDDMCAGGQDCMRSLIVHLEAMGIIEFVEEVST